MIYTGSTYILIVSINIIEWRRINMACFLVPMAEAIIVSVAKNIVEKKERNALFKESTSKEIKISSQIKVHNTLQTELDWTRKLSWLNNLLWGGVLLLALEHLWHGEIILWPPFLTAMRNPNDIIPMLHEMASVGTPMAISVTIAWGIMVFVAEYKIKHFLVKA